MRVQKMKKKIVKNILSLTAIALSFSLLPLVGCGSSSSDDDNGETEEAASENPIAMREENFLDGPLGNLWKPVSENNGNIVVLFRNTYRTLFSRGCTIELKDGTVAPLYCGGGLECFTNPDRLTLRSSVKCSNAKEVKVVCEEEMQTVTFTVPAELRGGNSSTEKNPHKHKPNQEGRKNLPK